MDSEGTNVEIIVSPNQSQDDRRGRPIEMKNPEDPNSLKRDVYLYAHKDMWKQAESILSKHADMVRIPLTATTGDTALHVAVRANSVTFVNELVKLMTRQDLDIRNSNGETAFSTAAVSGNGAFFQIMIEKNPHLPLISSYGEKYEMLPVHLAASTGHHKIVKELSSNNLLENMDEDDIRRLFFITIEKGMFDVATKLFEKYPDRFAVLRRKFSDDSGHDGDYPTALHLLARKRPEELSMKESNNEGAALQLLKNLWCQVRQLKPREIMGLITRPWPVMFDAIESGNVEAVKWILYMDRELLTVKHPDNERNLLQYSVLFRQSNLFSLMPKMSIPDHMLQAVDRDGNNLLHFAAYPLKKEETTSSLSATTKMRRELAWFKEVDKQVPAELRTMRNDGGKTAKDLFKDKHKDLCVEVKDTAKGIAESGMLVAALVATVAFAAALTVPGDKTNSWYIVFILANAAALFTSSASILSFLSNFTTSRFAQSEFVVSLHPSLVLGPILLLISIVTMVIAFAAASFLIFDHTTKWAPWLVASMGVLPILLFLLFQFSIFDTFLWSRFYRLS